MVLSLHLPIWELSPHLAPPCYFWVLPKGLLSHDHSKLFQLQPPWSSYCVLPPVSWHLMYFFACHYHLLIFTKSSGTSCRPLQAFICKVTLLIYRRQKRKRSRLNIRRKQPNAPERGQPACRTTGVPSSICLY